MILVLSEGDVSSVLGMADGIRLVENAFQEYANGKTLLVPRLNVNLPGGAGAFRAMAAVLLYASVFGLKTLTGYPGRRASNETYFALLLFDGRDGALRAVMAASHITGVRTGAAIGVAAKYLAREDATVLGIFGAGVQARHQIDTVAAVRTLDLVKVFGLDAAKAAALAREVETKLGVSARPAATPLELVGGSGLVITATTAREPAFLGDWLDSGTHTSGVGANSPVKRELDGETFRRNRVLVDFREQALDEAGDLQAAIKSWAMSMDDIYAELGDLVVGRKPGRENPGELTLFKSVGVAIQDIAVAAFVYEQAVAKRLGLQTELNADGETAVVQATSLAALPNADPTYPLTSGEPR